MPVTRTYRCDCGYSFSHFHHNRDEPYPECPACAGAVAWQPAGFAITTNRSKAVDLAQKMAEKNYGLTDMADNQREGDIAAPKVATPHTAEMESLTRAMKEQHEQAHAGPSADAPPNVNLQQFWQQASGQQLGDPKAYVAQGANEARAAGVDAVSLVEKAKSTGQDRMKFQVLAKATST